MVGTPKGLLFYDVSTQDSTARVARMPEVVQPRKISAKCNALFVMEGDGKMMIVDYSDLQYPAIRGSYDESDCTPFSIASQELRPSKVV
jgi:hypothetical protein